MSETEQVKKEETEQTKLKVDPQEKQTKEEKKKENGVKDESSVNHDDSEVADKTLNKTDDGNIGDNEEDEDDSDSDESLPPGLLERPVEILEEKRVRKKINRFNYDNEQPSPSSEKKKTAVVVPDGRGMKLADHPRVEFHLQRNKGEDLKIIHKFFYGYFGDQLSCKRNLRKFKGFAFEKDSPEYEKKEEIIGRFTVDNLKWAMEVCDCPHSKGNKKDDLIDAFMEWALCPKPQDKPVPGRKKKKEHSAKKKTTKRKMKAGKDDQSTDADTPAKRPYKKSGEKKKKPNASPKKKKSLSTSNKTAKIKISSPKTKFDTSSDSNSDDEPLQKKKGPPSNDEIRLFVEELLRGADLEVITMKSVFQQVYEQYPEFDLSDRKAFIKETVKKIIS